MDNSTMGSGTSSSRDMGVEDPRWTWEEDKQFENCLVEFPEDFPDRWGKIASKIRTRSAEDVQRHFDILLEDLRVIEAGMIESPEYRDRDLCVLPEALKCPKSDKKQTAGMQRKTGRPWTEDEHRLFLLGLEKYGKGDWKSISRYMVLTRNPTQVASHAQKHFERQEKEEQNKKRRSIFDHSIADTSTINKLNN